VLGLEILINGTRLRTAGTTGAANVCFTVDAFGEELRLAKPDRGPVVLRLGGLSSNPGRRSELLQWIEGHNCRVGDEITIRVLEVGVGELDQPVRVAMPAGVERMLVPRRTFGQRALSRVVGWFAARRRNAS
jgi:hypothetical protein